MRINEAEVIVSSDVDGTLVRPVDISDAEIIVKNPYTGKDIGYKIHHPHVDLLRQYKGRGFFIRVWSANGVKHAASIVVALGLDDGTVNDVETKPMKCLDDRIDGVHIIGNRIFLPYDGFKES